MQPSPKFLPLSTSKRVDRRQLGQFGEQFATAYLQNVLGWTIVTTNWRCRFGEVDIVARNGHGLVVVEVRTRRQDRVGDALESVDQRKRRQLARLLPHVMKAFQGDGSEVFRVDVIGLHVMQGEVVRFHHIRNGIEEFFN